MESSSVIIRNYVRESDLQGCAALLRELTAWHREMYHKPPIRWGPLDSDYDRDLDTVDPSLLWVAVHESKVIGMVGLLLKGKREGEISERIVEAEVEPIIVSREFRGKRIGERLLEKAIAEARARGARLVAVKPVARNIKTIQFFYKHGFTYVGDVELFMALSERSRKPGPRMFGCDFNMLPCVRTTRPHTDMKSPPHDIWK